VGLKLPFKLKPGCVIVLEGLDATGKSTQHERMEQACMGMGHGPTPLFDPAPLFLHMPSAGTEVGQAIYEMTEALTTELDPLARQYLHLASHAHSVKTLIRPAIKAGQPVILDRWWWSTVAYGWYNSKRVRNTFPSLIDFYSLCERTWRGVSPDLILLFMHPHVEDKHNTPAVEAGYHRIAKDWKPDNVVLIEQGDEGEQGEQLYAALLQHGLYWSE